MLLNAARPMNNGNSNASELVGVTIVLICP